MECPCCGGKRHHEIRYCAVYECKRCGAIHGTCYKGDSYSLVKPWFSQLPDPDPSEWRYFDLKVLGSKGVERRHGWFNPEDKCILQVG